MHDLLLELHAYPGEIHAHLIADHAKSRLLYVFISNLDILDDHPENVTIFYTFVKVGRFNICKSKQSICKTKFLDPGTTALCHRLNQNDAWYVVELRKAARQ